MAIFMCSAEIWQTKKKYYSTNTVLFAINTGLQIVVGQWNKKYIKGQQKETPLVPESNVT